MNIAIDRRFMMRHPAHVIALGFGAGLSLWAPGTVGTLWAWASFVVLHLYFDAVQLAWLIGLSLPLGWWASTVTARNLGVSDPGNIVWDEIVAFRPLTRRPKLPVFVLFRFFDAAKPGPVGWADRLFKGFGWRAGFGIMFDDLVAAFCTLLVIALWRTVT